MFRLHAVLGTLFTIVLYPPALLFALLCMPGAFMIGLVIGSSLVLGLVLLRDAFLIGTAFERDDLSMIPKHYTKWAMLHYSVVSIACFGLVFIGLLDWPLLLCALPGLYCLFAVFCAFNLETLIGATTTKADSLETPPLPLESNP